MFAALVSGGKDSLYSLYLMRENIKYVVSLISENQESYMFHVPNIEFVKYQASSMNLPLIQKTTKGEKEKELEDLKAAIKEISNEIDGLISGAIASEYQKSRIERICKELKLQSITPLWHKNPAELIRKMIDDGFEIIITAVAAPPLDEQWLGRKIDYSCLDEMIVLNKKYGIHVSGEGGEYETFVLDCPLFAKKIEVVESEKIWDENTKSGILEIKKIKLVRK
ncbi:MAG: diphthine--ammonia ligase [Candidatus Aenigmatarchaeota archaeon]